MALRTIDRPESVANEAACGDPDRKRATLCRSIRTKFALEGSAPGASYHASMRRSDSDELEPRLELMPLLDVVFLLLTFFVYALSVMVQAEVVEFEMAGVAGELPGERRALVILGIDTDGGLTLDGQEVTQSTLEDQLKALGGGGDDSGGPAQAGGGFPEVYVALSESADEGVDRGPVLLEVIQKLKAAGVERWAIVGSAASGGDPAGGSGTSGRGGGGGGRGGGEGGDG